jgi:SRSO17 transposase
MKYIIHDLIKSIVEIKLEYQIENSSSAVELFINEHHETGVDKSAFKEDFFSSKTGTAGEIIRKVVNNGFKIAIIGDYSNYNSEALKDFIYECNNGKDIFFSPELISGLGFLQRS